jgi:ABC-type nitrate/sulfonate/bicarbonate transport system substrate-binding protein
MDRRTLLTSAAASLLASQFMSSASLAAEAAKIRVQLGWINNVEYADVWLASENGLFAKAGVDPAVAPGGPNAPDPLRLLAAGSTDIAYTSIFPFIDAVKLGNDFVLVGAQFQSSPLGIISLPKKPIRTAADIPGKKILAQGVFEKSVIDATLALNKVTGTWTMVPTGYSPEPLLAGDGDGYTAFSTNQVVTLQLMGMVEGKDFFFVTFDQMGFLNYNDMMVVTRPWLNANRPALVGYFKALIEADAINEKDPVVAAKLVVDKYGANLGLDLKQQTQQNKLQLAMVRPGGDPKFPIYNVDPKLVAGPMYDAAKATGRTDLPDATKIVDPSIVLDAMAAARKS